MKSQVVTVTDTYASVKDLIDTARGEETLPNTFSSAIIISYDDPTDTETVTLKAEETENPVVVLDSSNDMITFTVDTTDFSKVYLKASASVDVGVIIEQVRKK